MERERGVEGEEKKKTLNRRHSELGGEEREDGEDRQKNMSYTDGDREVTERGGIKYGTLDIQYMQRIGRKGRLDG